MRDYNLYFEVTDIRKDGENISISDFEVPDIISKCLEYENKYPALFELEKNNLIKELIYKDYKDSFDYIFQKRNEIAEHKDKLCFDFYKE